MLLCIVSLILRWTLLDTTASYSRAEATLNGGKGESLKSRCWKSAEKSESSLNQFNQFRSLALHRKRAAMSDQLFYLQDSRSYVGNDVMWWAHEGNGYTTDLSKAQTYSKDEAQRMHNSRPSDIPWPKDYIDKKTRPAVDMQYIKRDEALAGTGIELLTSSPP